VRVDCVKVEKATNAARPSGGPRYRCVMRCDRVHGVCLGEYKVLAARPHDFKSLPTSSGSIVFTVFTPHNGIHQSPIRTRFDSTRQCTRLLLYPPLVLLPVALTSLRHSRFLLFGRASFFAPSPHIQRCSKISCTIFTRMSFATFNRRPTMLQQSTARLAASRRFSYHTISCCSFSASSIQILSSKIVRLDTSKCCFSTDPTTNTICPKSSLIEEANSLHKIQTNELTG
jgi:hypothetical protein